MHINRKNNIDLEEEKGGDNIMGGDDQTIMIMNLNIMV